MQKEYVKILIHKKNCGRFSGIMSEVLTYGYRSKVPGLAITRDIDKGYKTFSITHIKSGYGFLLSRFKSIKSAKEIINKFLAGIDWTGSKEQILDNPKAGKQVQKAQRFLYDNNNL